jgi:hypothetical protein
LETAEADPDSVGDMVSSFIDGDLFGEQLRSNYANIYLTKLDY